MTRKPNRCSSTAVGDNTKSAQRYPGEMERLLRVLTDHSPGHIAYVGANDLCYYFVNQKFESSFGRPREEIIGRHIKEIIGESNYEFALKYIEEVKTGKSSAYENVFDQYFATAHAYRFDQVCKMFDISYKNPSTNQELIDLIKQRPENNRSRMIEINTDRKVNFNLHQDIQNKIITALEK